jgi:sugar/nucleoside kinase (ribokinase family)
MKTDNFQKDIDLCGIGNGLVDLQFEVTDEEFAQFNLRKGGMALVSKDQQATLLEKLEEKAGLVCSGGSAANTIIAFSKFGGKAAYKTVLGDDDFGKFYAKEFKDMHIELRSPLIKGEQTGTCIVLITPDSERTMNTCLGATSLFSESQIDKDLIKRSKWIYIEGYKFSEKYATEAIFKALELAKKYDTKVAVTFSDTFITENYFDPLLKVAQNADLVFCNESEALSFTKMKDYDSAYIELCKITPNVVITRGVNGSLIKWQENEYTIPSFKAEAIDSTGAGDIFAAGFIYGILFNHHPELSGKLASYAASRIVSQFGARLKEDHEQLKLKIISKIL